MIRVMVVDDHEIMRSMLHDFIDLESDLLVCGDAATAEEAFGCIAECEPDLVLLDVALPDMSGIDAARVLRARYPDLPLAMLSGHGEKSHVDKAFQAGAAGYILKGDAEQIPRAIRIVMGGGRYVSDILEDGRAPEAMR